ncbi:putative phosphothreonine lyase domain-containg protein [Nocardia sp. NPDC052566]|uniref:putative phosphothreonine lyase domain-containing protein n=1 Tax=Nocardia sp. NPDC052566 TaxID=3364330 RepID=UPI0037CAC9D7
MADTNGLVGPGRLLPDRRWLSVWQPEGRYGSWGGKWLLFPEPAVLSYAWQLIAEATLAGQLGPKSEARTCGNLIRVYTGDHRDLADVSRVLAELRALGFRQRIIYKEDFAEMLGTHEALYCSQQNSSEVQQLRVSEAVRIWGPAGSPAVAGPERG